MEKKALQELLETIDGLLDDGQPEAAEKVAREALKVSPAEWSLWMALGQALSERGRFRAAAKAFLHAVSSEDGHQACTLTSWAQCEVECGDVLAAQDLVEAALRCDPDYPHASFVRAFLYEFADRDDAAEFWYWRAARLDPNSFFKPLRLPAEGFDHAVESAIGRLPEQYQELLPLFRLRARTLPPLSPRRRKCTALAPGETRPSRPGERDPSKPVIYLYQRNFERMCKSREELESEVMLFLEEELAKASAVAEE
jgi:tetratricopeptide (TPR) repeat protein